MAFTRSVGLPLMKVRHAFELQVLCVIGCPMDLGLLACSVAFSL